ncbi:PQQ-binding-like beta-propeller repeat protein [Streptomyces sp. TRM66268-LWL]|uniref:PQQ-binding-like beta-propeller repeat protein n=1 Tax=Streptomyces polyasparticus TaxID=2767826 RepID=A0ABR7SAH0_9ACTN|nr:PQQ-binding-like beta-propeller repeat protein [Streptomyces polyasparticus]MBC9711760.1 PQQ-binding-like beta-propeller repeat protein [Streptomyces polyasparticus]
MDTVEKKPATPEGELIAEMVPGDDIPPGVTARTPGSWATDKIFAKSDGAAVYGYTTQDAKEAWRIQLPGEICAASRHVTSSGMTAVITEEKRGTAGPEESCSELTAFDIDTGRQLWRKHLKEAEGYAPFMVGVTVSQGVVAATWKEGSVAFDLASGKQHWTKNAVSTCRDTAFGGGADLVAIVSCGDAEYPVVKAQKLDPVTGEARWTYKVSPGIKTVEVLSTRPTLLGLSAGDALTTDIAAVGDNGKLRSLIRLEGGRYKIDCETVMERCRGLAVSQDRVYLATKDSEFDLEKPANKIVGFDLDTGKVVGKSFPARPLQPLVPLRMSGDKVIAYRSLSNGVVVSLDPATGKQEVLMIHPLGDDDSRLANAYRSEVLYEHGRLFLSSTTMEQPPKGEEGDADTVVLMYGPAS